MAENTVPTAAEKHAAPDTREENRYLVPAVDIYEKEDMLTVVADLPGVAKDNLSIDVEEDTLTIKGKADYRPEGRALDSEFYLADYYRQFRLSDRLDPERFEAEFRNGVLTIRMPKQEKQRPRQIDVKFN